jgi:RNA polymerase sigma-70 factor (ECF subfamily)
MEKDAPKTEGAVFHRMKPRRRLPREDLDASGPDEPKIELKWLTRTRVDADCFDYFVTKYLVRIRRYLARHVADPVLVDDLTHETFVRAFEKLDQFHFRGLTMGGWLYRIARSLRDKHWRDYEKPRRRHVRLDQVSLVAGETPEESTGRRETAEALHEALGGLRREYREVLELHYWEGMKTLEIAVVLDRKHNTVKGWLKRARSDLGSLLASGDHLPTSPSDCQAHELETEATPRTPLRAQRQEEA